MFSVCTSFDSKYLKYGYPLLCSIVNRYPVNIYVLGINFTKPDIKKIRSMPNMVLFTEKIDLPIDHPDYFKMCFASKVSALEKSLYESKNNVVLVDADCLFLDRLDKFEEEFDEKSYDLGAFCRFEKDKEYLKFCSHNVFLRNNDYSKKFVREWNNLIPSWDNSNLNVSSAYAEQCCMYTSYVNNKNNLKLLDISKMEIPILHIKGAKYPFHKKYNEMQYESKCNKEVEEYQKNR